MVMMCAPSPGSGKRMMEFDDQEIKNEYNIPDERTCRRLLLLVQNHQQSLKKVYNTNYHKKRKENEQSKQQEQTRINQQLQQQLDVANSIRQEQTRINQQLQQQLDVANSTIQQLQEQVDDANSTIQQLQSCIVENEKSFQNISEDRNDYRVKYGHLVQAWANVSKKEKYNVLLKHLNGEDGSWKIIEVDGDGNCLFRAVAAQLESEVSYSNLRAQCYNYCKEHEPKFRNWFQGILSKEQFDEDFKKMKIPGTYASVLELCVLESVTKKKIYYYTIQDTSFTRSAIEVPSKELCEGEIILVYSVDENSVLNHYDAIVKDCPNPPPQNDNRKRARRK
jgi:hypothetical protein